MKDPISRWILILFAAQMLAAQMFAAGDPALQARLQAYRDELAEAATAAKLE